MGPNLLTRPNGILQKGLYGVILSTITHIIKNETLQMTSDTLQKDQNRLQTQFK